MGSHMGSEEYEPDAKPFFKKDNQDLDMEDLGMEDHAQMLKFFKSTATTPKQALADGYNPYMNGYAWETKVSTDGKPVTEKLWAMGRQSWELAYVMPDRKTVYGTDDGKDVIFSKFVAKKAGDMSEGHLYCAKFGQQTPAAGGSADKFFADISWVDMGSAKASEILQSINDFNSTDKPTTFSDLFKEGKVDESGKKCVDEGYVLVNAGGRGAECLKCELHCSAVLAVLFARTSCFFCPYLTCRDVSR